MKDYMAKEFQPVLIKKPIKVADYFIEDDFVDADGEPFIKFAPMLRVANKIFDTVELRPLDIKILEGSEGLIAAAQISWTFTLQDDSVEYGGTADCGPHNPAKGAGNFYPSAIAETRAAAKALRYALGLDFCSYEEISPSPKSTMPDPITKAQSRTIEKFFDNKNKSLEDVSNILGRTFDSLEQLSKKQASKVLTVFNKEG